jgi:D-alanyl-D-alanine carboxypeptidase
VNKKHKLPSDYVPSVSTASGATMRPEAIDALKNLLADAQNTGVPMKVLSSYRSYSTQVSTYNRWVNQSGQDAADTFSARPGHSEHQLGLAVDLGELDSTTCDLETCFGNTPAGNWLASNAQNYGFIIRYPSGKQTETGYQYEPWHLRYVGAEVAIAIKNSSQTLDQYYGVEAGGY